MTLPVGTALQNGNYVIDAFCFEDSLGPTYLATHVLSGQRRQIKVLGSQRPDQIPGPEVRSQFRDYLQQVSQLQHPHIVPNLQGIEEDGISYLLMSADIGQPLTTRITPKTPLTARSALQALQQIKHTLEALRPLGWCCLVLQPDQIWLHNRRLLLSGFGLPLETSEGLAQRVDSSEDSTIVPQLARLLFFLLTGERAEKIKAPAVHLRHRHPGLDAGFEAAIEQGLAEPTQPSALPTLAAWLELLPEAPLQHFPASESPNGQTAAVSVLQAVQPEDRLKSEATETPEDARVPTPSSEAVEATAAVATSETPAAVVALPTVALNQTVASPSEAAEHLDIASGQDSDVASDQGSHRSFWRRPQFALVFTGMLASVAGLGFGLSLRLHTPVSSGESRLNPEQSFPPLSDWQGDDPVAEFDTPYLPNDRGRERSEEAPSNRPLAPEPIETPFERAPVRPARPLVPEVAPEPDDGGAAPAVDLPAEIDSTEPSMSDPLSPSPLQPSTPAPNSELPAAPAPPAPLPAPVPPVIEKAPPPQSAPSFSRSPAPALGSAAPAVPVQGAP
ncbi:MAG TPA: hypothetical protein V6D06_20645 [Trichocoleus sp.]